MCPRNPWSIHDDPIAIPNGDLEGWLVAGAGRPRPRRYAAHGSSLGIRRGESPAASRKAPAAHASQQNFDNAGQGHGIVIWCKRDEGGGARFDGMGLMRRYALMPDTSRRAFMSTLPSNEPPPF